MRQFTYFPPLDLAPYVDRLWGWESDAKETLALPTLLPGTGAELYFHYRKPFEYDASMSPRSEKAHLFCLRRTALELMPAQDTGFIAVRFRAGMLHRFLDIPGEELIDCAEAMDDIWGSAGRIVAANVADAKSHEARTSLIVAFLRSRLAATAKDEVVEAAVSMLYGAPSLSIETLSTSLGLGRRQLERRFQGLTGQRPSEFRRLVRFQKTARALLLTPNANALDTALAHGYYDQSHFIRDFRSFAQASPQAYLATARHKTHFYNRSRTDSENMAPPATTIERKVRANIVRRT
ncbi:MAG TPA: helix-turn-helix domain-containing protein [Rhodocyclaceae bacterium]|nr:helix-turn-helix domain-containing protein [Rhodocyclaceae bacterium]